MLQDPTDCAMLKEIVWHRLANCPQGATFLASLGEQARPCDLVHAMKAEVTASPSSTGPRSFLHLLVLLGFPGGAGDKEPPCCQCGDVRDVGSIPAPGRS